MKVSIHKGPDFEERKQECYRLMLEFVKREIAKEALAARKKEQPQMKG